VKLPVVADENETSLTRVNSVPTGGAKLRVKFTVVPVALKLPNCARGTVVAEWKVAFRTAACALPQSTNITQRSLMRRKAVMIMLK
jgi:hypothetical protein